MIFYLFIKRILDIIFGIIGLIILIPIALIVKISYMLNGDFYSIFYSQARIGKNGKLFKICKFRTMIPNADEELYKILKNDPKLRKEYEENKKLRKDPRITKCGRFLRKTSIDEMPQFLQVLTGSMSLIGNRPYLPREKEEMGKYFNDIVSVKPGITGYWQVSGHNDTNFKQRLELEEAYSKKASLALDAKIFFKTFGVVMNKKGI